MIANHISQFILDCCFFIYVYWAFLGACFIPRTASVSALKRTISIKFSCFSYIAGFNQSILLSQCPRKARPCLPKSITTFNSDSITFWFASSYFFASLSSIILTELYLAKNSLILVHAVKW